jgi:hypothetical protein
MSRDLRRRLAALERLAVPVTVSPAFVLAGSRAEADREVERIAALYPTAAGALFIMMAPDMAHADCKGA